MDSLLNFVFDYIDGVLCGIFMIVGILVAMLLSLFPILKSRRVMSAALIVLGVLTLLNVFTGADPLSIPRLVSTIESISLILLFFTPILGTWLSYKQKRARLGLSIFLLYLGALSIFVLRSYTLRYYDGANPRGSCSELGVKQVETYWG